MFKLLQCKFQDMQQRTYGRATQLSWEKIFVLSVEQLLICFVVTGYVHLIQTISHRCSWMSPTTLLWISGLNCYGT